MAFSFKIDNPVAKLGFFVMIPVAAIMLAYSIAAQSCGEQEVADAGDASVTVTSTKAQ